MLVLTFEEFNIKFNVDNSAMSDIRIKDKGKDISLAPIEIVMRDQTPDNTSDPNSNIIVNLHPPEGTHWVLVIRREGGLVYYFDNFGVETPPLFLEEYVDLGSNERIQQYDESYCGAYCLYLIYLIDRGFTFKSALIVLVNQVKCPEIYNECFCLGCNVNQGTCFADDNDNVNVNDNDKDDTVNQGTCLASHEQSSFADDNDKDNDNDSVTILLMIRIIREPASQMIMLMLMIMIMLIIMLMIITMIKILIMIIREPASQMIMLMLRIMIMLMIMLMIKTRTMIMLMIMLIREPASQMIILYIREPALKIYLMKNIKGVNLITIVLLTISL